MSVLGGPSDKLCVCMGGEGSWNFEKRTGGQELEEGSECAYNPVLKKALVQS